ncbi:MAG TPA: helix-turn-helix transcriptional regulator [Bacillus sp. (in: firmicutes)]|nr:helix-turn-helix transcriptional regulator [Bacillus sp. (in: firmicutes)]
MIDYRSLGVGKIIETLRRRKRLTQQEVAFRCNLDRKTISNIERNDSSPSVETLLNIILALNVTPSEFVVEFEKHTNILDYYPYSEDMP